MAARKTYKLCGFCPELDWRPTAFVGPIPPCKVCAWCGVIPVTGVLLPCGELVCLPCREKNGTCASHGTTFAEHELEMAMFSARHMMSRKARRPLYFEVCLQCEPEIWAVESTTRVPFRLFEVNNDRL
ncbi:hypothetical protein MTO96_001158 [Rhipicephalus appendiculatus]